MASRERLVSMEPRVARALLDTTVAMEPTAPRETTEHEDLRETRGSRATRETQECLASRAALVVTDRMVLRVSKA